MATLAQLKKAVNKTTVQVFISELEIEWESPYISGDYHTSVVQWQDYETKAEVYDIVINELMQLVACDGCNSAECGQYTHTETPTLEGVN